MEHPLVDAHKKVFFYFEHLKNGGKDSANSYFEKNIAQDIIHCRSKMTKPDLVEDF